MAGRKNAVVGSAAILFVLITIIQLSFQPFKPPTFKSALDAKWFPHLSSSQRQDKQGTPIDSLNTDSTSHQDDVESNMFSANATAPSFSSITDSPSSTTTPSTSEHTESFDSNAS